MSCRWKISSSPNRHWHGWARLYAECSEHLPGKSLSNDTLEGMHRFEIPASDLASWHVRRELEALEYDFPAETVDLLQLATSELVTNAVRHSDTDTVIIYIRVSAPSLLVKVCNKGMRVEAKVNEAELMDEGGRGLFVVEAVANDWGTSEIEIRGSAWACVWACFGAEHLPSRVKKTA